MRFILAALAVLMLAIGLFVMALTNAQERIPALLCMLISAVLGTGSAVLGTLHRVSRQLPAMRDTTVDPHRYPPER